MMISKLIRVVFLIRKMQGQYVWLYSSLCWCSESLIFLMKSAFSTQPTHSMPRSPRIFFSCLTRSLV